MLEVDPVLIALKTNSHLEKWERSICYQLTAWAPQAMQDSTSLLQSPVPGQPAVLHPCGMDITAKKWTAFKIAAFIRFSLWCGEKVQ